MKKLLILILSGAMVLILSGVGFGAEYVYNFTPKDNNLDNLDHYKAYSWEIDMTGTGYDSDQVITSMVLTFDDIYDNSNDSDNKIYLSVLGSAGEEGEKIKDWDGQGWYEKDRFVRNGDVDYYEDTDSGYVNYFTHNDLNDTGAVSELYVIENISTKSYKKNDIEITFTNDTNGTVTIVTETKKNDGSTVDTTTATFSSSGVEDLFDWAKDGIFELGFDPDCHFKNNGVSLMVYTSDTPSGASPTPEPETLVLFGFGLLGLSAFGRKRFGSIG